MEYEEFEQEMDELLEDYKHFILWLKDNISSIKDIVKNFYEILPKVMLIWGATKAIAEDMEDLSAMIQRKYFAEYLDGVFEFKNPLLESFDRHLFELIFYFLDYFGDKIIDGAKDMNFKTFATEVMKDSKTSKAVVKITKK